MNSPAKTAEMSVFMADETTKDEQQPNPVGRPRILQRLETTISLIDLYFKTNPEKPTIAGLAIHLGFSDSKSVRDYMDRDDEFSPPIKKAIGRIEAEHESRLYGPNCTGSIFWLKNKGWTDSHDVTSGGKPIPQTVVSFLDALKQPGDPDEDKANKPDVVPE